MSLRVGGASNITLHRAPKVEYRDRLVVKEVRVPVERVPPLATAAIYLEGLAIALLLWSPW